MAGEAWQIAQIGPAARGTASWCSRNPETVAAFFSQDGSLNVNDDPQALKAFDEICGSGRLTAHPESIRQTTVHQKVNFRMGDQPVPALGFEAAQVAPDAPVQVYPHMGTV